MGTGLNAIVVFLVLCSTLTTSEKVDFDLTDIMAIAQMIGGGESSALRESDAAWHEENKVLYSVAQAQGVRKTPPPGKNGGPLRLDTTFVIDHVEPLDEDQETMTVHGSVTLKWSDPTYTWNPEKFSQIHVVSRSLSEFTASFRPWIPAVSFRTADPSDNRRAESAEGMATILTATSTGEIALHKKFTVKAPCNFDYRNFPYDSQRCSLILTSQNSLREVWLSYDGDQSKHSIRQLKKEGASPMIGDFVLDYVHVFNAVTRNEFNLEQIKTSWEDQKKIRYDGYKLSAIVAISFNRANEKYFYSFSLPLVALALMAQAAMFFDTKKGFLMLAVPLIMLTSQLGLISQRFPSDADGTPLLVVMHYVSVVHIFVCFVGLVLLSHFYGARVGITKDRKSAPDHYFLDETHARLVHFIITLLFVVVIAVGTLWFGTWGEWNDDSD